MNTKPQNVQLISIFMILSGALNILVGSGIAVGIILGTFFLGLLCLPVLLIPIGIGIFEIITGINILNSKPVRNVQLVGWLEVASVLWGNVLSMAAGILVLVFYNDPETKTYFERMG